MCDFYYLLFIIFIYITWSLRTICSELGSVTLRCEQAQITVLKFEIGIVSCFVHCIA